MSETEFDTQTEETEEVDAQTELDAAIAEAHEALSDTPAVVAMTPYQAAKYVNKWLQDDGFVDRKVPPQMLYTYTLPGKNVIDTVTVDGKRRVTLSALKKWYVGYVAKIRNVAALEDVESPIASGEVTEAE